MSYLARFVSLFFAIWNFLNYLNDLPQGCGDDLEAWICFRSQKMESYFACRVFTTSKQGFLHVLRRGNCASLQGMVVPLRRMIFRTVQKKHLPIL
jgi:hypothetical protein